MVYKYSFENYNKESMARGCSVNSAISTKKSVETARLIRGKKVETAISMLEKVVEQKLAVPYKRYKTEMAHRKGKGIDTGGYPVNVAKEFLRVLKAVKKNALEKELSSSNLFIIAISVRQGVGRYHNGRHVGRKMKSTNLEIIVGEKKKK
ncbi:MAG: 50S ribosomal protein L22 [Nanoarchaeota archaeon]